MFFIYNLLLLIIFPVFVIYVVIASIFVKKWRKGLFKKFGFYNTSCLDRSIIFHCVSVGETLSVVPLIKRFVVEHKNTVFTVTTKTGFEVATKNLINLVREISFFPYDFFFSISRFFRCFKPQSIIVVETEIWPNLIFFAREIRVPVVFINGRISDRSFPKYLRFKFFFKRFLDYPFFLMQTEEDKERILALGAKPSQVFVTGNIKYDMEKEVKIIKKTEFGIREEDVVLIAGSTHEGEEAIIIDSFIILKKQFANLKLIIAPRHPERFETVFSLLKQKGVDFGRRSNKEDIRDVYVLDTLGELFSFYGLADIAFVGGSLVNIGGHNIIEPASYGIPVIFGPYMQNFREISEQFLSVHAAVTVNSQNMTQTLAELVSDKEKRKSIGNQAKLITERNKGSLEKTLKLINFIIGK